ncbi:hypothetical protein BGZ54_006284 [Gamsiella multidivaricata]|nr:hypothetical protein BGZ54_006284 [Gamsiella multidivaricata]
MDEILAGRSKVPAVSGRKKPASTTTAAGFMSQKKDAKISKAEKAKLLDLIRRRTSNSLFAPVTKPLGRTGLTDAVKQAGRFDVWGADADADAEKDDSENNNNKDDKNDQDDNDNSGDEDEDQEMKDVDDFVSEIVTKRAVKAPRSFRQKQKVVLPAVKAAHPGASYNPTMQDHQGLLLLAHNEELRFIREREKVEARLAYPKELDAMVPFDDQTGGLLENSEDEEEEDEEDEEDEGEEGQEGVVKGKRQKGKKSITERNRLARAAETAKKEARIRREKELMKQTNKVKEIMKTVEEEEAEAEERRLENERKKEEREKAGMKRVGRFNIPKERIHVQLQDELPESLRQLKPEGSLMKDRFQSFVERNLIEPRVPVAKRRRYRLKTYEKHSYKRFDNPNHA